MEINPVSEFLAMITCDFSTKTLVEVGVIVSAISLALYIVPLPSLKTIRNFAETFFKMIICGLITLSIYILIQDPTNTEYPLVLGDYNVLPIYLISSCVLCLIFLPNVFSTDNTEKK